MADLYSIIAGLEPDQQDIIEAELLATQILSAQYPDLDLREGTAARDLAVRPGAFLLALCKTGFDYYFSHNTLNNVTDATDTSVVDAILGNMFMTRNLGTYAVISARLYFSIQKNITLTTSTGFSTDSTTLFYPPTNLTVPASGLTYDSYEQEWYVDVNLVAASTGTQYNLSSGSLLYFSNFDPFFLHAEINYLASTSTSSETNTQFIARAQSNISTRNLINQPSIASNLTSNFNYLNQVTTIPSGDLRMFRDQVLIKGATPWTKLSTSNVLVGSNTRFQLTIANHGLIAGQLVNINQIGGIQLKNCPVYSIDSANVFEVSLGISGLSGIQNNCWVTPSEPDIYVHNAGCVDVYVGNTTYVTNEQLTFNSSGVAHTYGSIYNLVRIAGSGDTIAPGVGTMSIISEDQTNPIYQTVGNVTFSQDGTTHVLTCTTPIPHCLTPERMVQINGWPAPAGAPWYLTVQTVLDGHNFTLGRDLSAITVLAGCVPSIVYVNPVNDNGFSNENTITLVGSSDYIGQLATYEVYRHANVDSVDAYLSDSNNRVVTGNLLARGYDLYILAVNLVTYEAVAPTTGTISAILTPYLAGLAPGQNFVVADMMAALSAGGISMLQNPPGITFQFYNRDMFGTLFTPVTGTATDYIYPLSSTSVYILGDITVNTATIQ